MIHMPRRSVTRFFVPLIDVLLLLFCIFLMMTFSSGTEVEKQEEEAAEARESAQLLEEELQRRTRDLQRYDQLKNDLEKVAQLQEELDRIQALLRQSVQERTAFHLIDVDPKTGEIFYFDGRLPRVDLKNSEHVKALIEKHRNDVQGKRELYYYFLYPRPFTGYPTVGQERRYKAWFGSVSNSLQGTRP